MPLSAGDRLGRYEILTQLGSGGMGEVYRAVDTALARDVAIKVLPDGVASDPGRLERFKRETRAVAALSHPNILEIHDVGEQGPVHYAVTELLEGETLRQRIPASGLSWQAVVEIGAEIAEALAAAHDRGIIHRDVKPDNVFVTSAGRTKVLDFGLARLQEETSSERPIGELEQNVTQTQTGTLLGTMGYVAPELLSGGRADARSDIFALGCVLCEMVTGRRAFLRETAERTVWATLHEEPPPPSSIGVVLPDPLEHTVARCLEKNPDARFQSAADLAFALRAIGSGSGSASNATPLPPGSRADRRIAALGVVAVLVVIAALALVFVGPQLRPRSEPAGPELDPGRVVVLPFENRTGDPDQDVIGLMAADWLTQGMPDTVGIDVIASSSAIAATRRVGGGSGGSFDVARLLDAGTLVTGTYYRQGDQLRIKAEIAATSTGELLHSIDPVAGPISDPMSVVEPLRQQILGLLAGKDPNIAKFTASTFDAYRELTAGLEIWLEKPEVGLEHFRRASELDPDSFIARLMTSHALDFLKRDEESRAVLDELDDRRHLLSSFDRLCLDCVLLRREHRYAEALPLLREIVALDPLNPHITIGYVDALAWTNHPREAVSVLERLGDLDKPDIPHVFSICLALHVLGEHDRELEVSQEALTRFPRFQGEIRWGLFFNQVNALGALGRSDELAVLLAEHSKESAPVGAWLALNASVELRAHGQPGAAREIAEQALQRLPLDPALPARTQWVQGVLLLLVDRPEDGLALFSAVAAQTPDNVVHVGSVGAMAARLGDRENALGVLRRIDELASPRLYGEDHYMRACIAAELGEREQAVKQLHAALDAGFQFNLTFHRNPWLDSLHGYEPFEEFLRPKG